MKYKTTQVISDALRVQGRPKEGVRELETNQLVSCRLHIYRINSSHSYIVLTIGNIHLFHLPISHVILILR